MAVNGLFGSKNTGPWEGAIAQHFRSPKTLTVSRHSCISQVPPKRREKLSEAAVLIGAFWEGKLRHLKIPILTPLRPANNTPQPDCRSKDLPSRTRFRIPAALAGSVKAHTPAPRRPKGILISSPAYSASSSWPTWQFPPFEQS